MSVVAPVPPFATPRVPASVMVPEPVIGPPDVVRPVVPPETATLVTVPAPAGVAHVPSPRQKVEDDADVPEFKFVTGRFPVTPDVRGNPVALVRTAAEGVPKAGVVKLGLVVIATLPVPLMVYSPTVPALS